MAVGWTVIGNFKSIYRRDPREKQQCELKIIKPIAISAYSAISAVKDL